MFNLNRPSTYSGAKHLACEINVGNVPQDSWPDLEFVIRTDIVFESVKVSEGISDARLSSYVIKSMAPSL